MSQTLSSEPIEINAGDTITWLRSLPLYSAVDGWSLNYALRGPSAINISAIGTGTEHQVSIDPVTSGGYVSGLYAIQGYVTNGINRVTIYNGNVTIQPDLVASGAGYDGRSFAKRMLDAIEAVSENRASKTQLETNIDGTLLKYKTDEQLAVLRIRYLNEYRAEQRRAGIKNGKKSGRRILMRFT